MQTRAEQAARYIALRRRIEVLTQLQSPPTRRDLIARLRQALQRLLEIEGLGSRGGHTAPGALVQAIEDEATRYATEAGVPACAPPTSGAASPAQGNMPPASGTVPPASGSVPPAEG